MARRGRPRKVTRREPSGRPERPKGPPWTQQTKERARPHHVQAVHGEGSNEHEAALAIARAVKWITSRLPGVDLACKGSNPNPLRGVKPDAEDMPDYVEQYCDWCDEMDRSEMPVGPVLDLAQDDPPRGDRLIEAWAGLRVYIKMRGWS